MLGHPLNLSPVTVVAAPAAAAAAAAGRRSASGMTRERRPAAGPRASSVREPAAQVSAPSGSLSTASAPAPDQAGIPAQPLGRRAPADRLGGSDSVYVQGIAQLSLTFATARASAAGFSAAMGGWITR